MNIVPGLSSVVTDFDVVVGVGGSLFVALVVFSGSAEAPGVVAVTLRFAVVLDVVGDDTLPAVVLVVLSVVGILIIGLEVVAIGAAKEFIHIYSTWIKPKK